MKFGSLAGHGVQDQKCGIISGQAVIRFVQKHVKFFKVKFSLLKSTIFFAKKHHDLFKIKVLFVQKK